MSSKLKQLSLILTLVGVGELIAADDSLQQSRYESALARLDILADHHSNSKKIEEAEKLPETLRLKFSQALLLTSDEAKKKAYEIAKVMDEKRYQRDLEHSNRTKKNQNERSEPTRDNFYTKSLDKIQKPELYIEYQKTVLFGIGHYLYLRILIDEANILKSYADGYSQALSIIRIHQKSFLGTYSELTSENQKKIDNIAELRGINLKEIFSSIK